MGEYSAIRVNVNETSGYLLQFAIASFLNENIVNWRGLPNASFLPFLPYVLGEYVTEQVSYKIILWLVGKDYVSRIANAEGKYPIYFHSNVGREEATSCDIQRLLCEHVMCGKARFPREDASLDSGNSQLMINL